MFRADASAASGNDRYPAGERHALLAFIRQPAGAEYDWANVERVIVEAGWGAVTIHKAGRLALDPASADEVLDSAHRDAAENGSSIVVYAEPINDT